MPHGSQVATVRFNVGSSGSFLDFAGADARRANADLFPHASHHRAQALQVRIPPASPRVICVADHISIMRRFAAKFTLQCHISSCFSFIWAWIYCSKCRQTKLLILADPTTCGKARLLRTGWFYGARLLCSGWFLGRAVRLRTILRVNLLHPKAPSPPLALLFFRTGFARPLRTSNGSNRIEITRVARKRNIRLAARTIVDRVPPT